MICRPLHSFKVSIYCGLFLINVLILEFEDSNLIGNSNTLLLVLLTNFKNSFWFILLTSTFLEYKIVGLISLWIVLFFNSDNLENIWGENWESKPSNGYPLPPDLEFIRKVGTLKNGQTPFSFQVYEAQEIAFVDELNDWQIFTPKDGSLFTGSVLLEEGEIKVFAKYDNSLKSSSNSWHEIMKFQVAK